MFNLILKTQCTNNEITFKVKNDLAFFEANARYYYGDVADPTQTYSAKYNQEDLYNGKYKDEVFYNIINYKMEAKMSSPLFYIYKVLKNRKKMQSNHNRKFRCPFSFCAKAYNHKNKMLAHLRTHVYILSFNPI